MWRPGPDFETLRSRAALFAVVRSFFAARGVLEVDCPVIADRTASDTHLESIMLADGRYLLPSPEPYMKRLLAAGTGAIYTLARSFRAHETGARHNTEFVMLEWYRPDFALLALESELLDLLAALSALPSCSAAFVKPDELSSPARFSYSQLMIEASGIDPLAEEFDVNSRTVGAEDELRSRANELLPDSCELVATLEVPALFDLLFSRFAEPELSRYPVAIVQGFPPTQAAQARLVKDEKGRMVAARFELYLQGVEIANAYHELNDEAEFRARHESDQRRRRSLGLPVTALDEALAAATGLMPDCSGIAVGFDRLLMSLLDTRKIRNVLSFTAER